MPEPYINPPTLSVYIEGLPDFDISQDVHSIRFSESRARGNLLEVSLNNWDATTLGFKYSDGDLLHIGARIKLYSGDFTLATGTIIRLAPDFNSGSPPSLMFTASMQRLRQQASQTMLSLAYGSGLYEFHPALRKTCILRRPTIQATGTTMLSPDLKVGDELNITGVGNYWSGIYRVTESIHRFALENNPLTSFTCSKPWSARQ